MAGKSFLQLKSRLLTKYYWHVYLKKIAISRTSCQQQILISKGVTRGYFLNGYIPAEIFYSLDMLSSYCRVILSPSNRSSMFAVYMVKVISHVLTNRQNTSTNSTLPLAPRGKLSHKYDARISNNFVPLSADILVHVQKS